MTSRKLQPRKRTDLIQPPYSQPVPDEEEPIPGETVPRRNSRYVDELLKTPTKAPEVTTLWELLLWSAAKYKTNRCVGARVVKGVAKEDWKVEHEHEDEIEHRHWVVWELGPYLWRSFEEFVAYVKSLGSGLRALEGAMPGAVKVHIFASPSLHWLAMAHAVSSQSLAFVAVYDALSEDDLKHSIQQTKTSILYCDAYLLGTVAAVLDETPSIKHVVYDNTVRPKEEDLDVIRDRYPQIQLLSIEQLRDMGKDNPVEPMPPLPSDLACIMYTAASEGPAKGVPLRHSNIIASIAGAGAILGECVTMKDTALAYLSQAYIWEFLFENLCLYWGASIGYGAPHTLTEASGSLRNCQGDIPELKPSIFIGVPAVWEAMKKGILGVVDASNFAVRGSFYAALWLKRFLLRHNLSGSSVLDSILLKKPKQATGGNLRLHVTTGGPVSPRTQETISLLFGTLIDGYGLTETSAMGALNDPLLWTCGAVGDISPSVEIKLVDWSEAGYVVTNRPHAQGEILIRGPSVVDRYFDAPAETATAFTADGWFRTGDIGEFDEVGHLKVIDRKRDLVKNANMEYIALEKLESIYRSAPVVWNVCVYVDAHETRPVAVVLPNREVLFRLAELLDLDMEQQTLQTLIRNPEIEKIVLRSLQDFGRKGKLQPSEIVVGVVMDEGDWSVDNGCLSMGQKLIRWRIFERSKHGIEEIYAKSKK